MTSILSLPPESQAEASVSILSMAASRVAAQSSPRNGSAGYLDALARSLKSFAEDDSEIDQRKFWRLYKELSVETINLADLAKVAQLNFDWKFELPDVANLDLLYTTNFDKLADCCFSVQPDYPVKTFAYIAECKSLRPLFLDRSLFVDQAQPLFFESFYDIAHEISHKAARRAIKATIAEINLDDARSIAEVVRLIGSTLTEKIYLSVRLVIRARFAKTSRTRDDDTRHRVLNFSIHTGNSPPSTLSRSRSVVGQALVAQCA
jgi:hypothetical protein